MSPTWSQFATLIVILCSCAKVTVPENVSETAVLQGRSSGAPLPLGPDDPSLEVQASTGANTRIAASAASHLPTRRYLGDRPTRFVPLEGAKAFTWDSRIAIFTINGSWMVAALRPERMKRKADGTPLFPEDAVGARIPFSHPFDGRMDRYNDLAIGRAYSAEGVHAINPYRSDANGTPQAKGSFETYLVQVIADSGAQSRQPLLNGESAAPPATLLEGQLRVTVSNPKTAFAEVTSTAWSQPMRTILAPQTKEAGASLQPVTCIEPTMDEYSGLIVCHWQLPLRGQNLLRYLYRRDDGSWSAPDLLGRMHEAERNTAIRGRKFSDWFPLAARPLRYGDGNVVPPALKGAYPWLTPAASEIFFTTTQIASNDGPLRRGAGVVLGQRTGFLMRHFDTVFNADRSTHHRLTLTGLLEVPGPWDPFRQTKDAILPYTSARSSIGIVDPHGMYSEIRFDPFELGYSVYLEMRELVVAQADQNNQLDTTRVTDESGNGNVAHLANVRFPDDFGLGSDFFGAPSGAGKWGMGITNNFVFVSPTSRIVVGGNGTGINTPRNLTTGVFFRAEPGFQLGCDSPFGLAVRARAWSLMMKKCQGQVTLEARVVGHDGRSASTSTTLDEASVLQWHSYALRFNRSRGITQLFVDGQLRSQSAPQAELVTDNSTESIWIATNGKGSGTIGRVDRYFLAPYLLSDDELAREMLGVMSLGPSHTWVDLPTGLRQSDLNLLKNTPPSENLVSLGDKLFSETALSRNRKVSCASCHGEDNAFVDGRPVARALGIGDRNTPTIENSAFRTRQGWDGAAMSLEEQALRPVMNPVEMGHPNLEAAAQALTNLGYGAKFRSAFGNEQITARKIGTAIAAYMRSRMRANSDADRYDEGDLNQLSVSAVRGRGLFFGKARCATCHSGSMYTDELFHRVELETGSDAGRRRYTSLTAHDRQFKTPSLRGLLVSPPYFHDGSAATLEEVVDRYNAGGLRRQNVDFRLIPLNLSSQERSDLVAFLRSLNGNSTTTRFSNTPLERLEDFPTEVTPSRAWRERFVRRNLYRLLLRQPQEATVKEIMGAWDASPLPRAAVVRLMLQTDEVAQSRANYLFKVLQKYKSANSIVPIPEDLAAPIRKPLKRGANLLSLAESLLGNATLSAEVWGCVDCFKQVPDFTSRAFAIFLGRPATATDISFWANYSSQPGLDRAAEFRAIGQSSEACLRALLDVWQQLAASGVRLDPLAERNRSAAAICSARPSSDYFEKAWYRILTTDPRFDVP